MVQHVTKHATHVTFGDGGDVRSVPAAMFFWRCKLVGVIYDRAQGRFGKGKRGERGENKAFNFPAALGSIFWPQAIFFFWKSEPIAMDGFLLRRGGILYV